jgi:hypothetical protein
MPRKPKPEPLDQPSQVVFELLRIKGGREVPAFYANSVQVLVSLFDFTLIIGQAGFGPDGEPEMREVAKLNLSPQHAKALTVMLANRVAVYESQFGTIAVDLPNEPPPPS